jgi:small-conductance mechanosensitive channel
MEKYNLQIIETAISVLLFFVIKFSIGKIVSKFVSDDFFKKAEKKDILKLINLLIFIAFTIIIIAIWGVDQGKILVFASSVLTVFGVALFAEMSILSNITACLILFFQHPIKVGDHISVTFEGKEVEGELIEISYFFVFIKTEKSGILTVPNALFLKSSFLVTSK